MLLEFELVLRKLWYEGLISFPMMDVQPFLKALEFRDNQSSVHGQSLSSGQKTFYVISTFISNHFAILHHDCCQTRNRLGWVFFKNE